MRNTFLAWNVGRSLNEVSVHSLTKKSCHAVDMMTRTTMAASLAQKKFTLTWGGEHKTSSWPAFDPCQAHRSCFTQHAREYLKSTHPSGNKALRVLRPGLIQSLQNPPVPVTLKLVFSMFFRCMAQSRERSDFRIQHVFFLIFRIGICDLPRT
jgi:hypothetical protein